MTTMFCLRILALATCAGIVATQTPTSEPRDYLMPCYYTSWSNYRTGAATYFIEYYQPGLCTHIVYAFAQVNDNQVRAYDVYDLADNSGNEKNGWFARVNALKKKQPDLKTLISVGGFTDNITMTGEFEKMLATEEGRATFALSALDFVVKHGFDGMEIWYAPKAEEKDNFTALIQDLKHGFHGHFLLSVAVENDPQPWGYDIPALGEAADWVNVLTQNFHHDWNTTGFASNLDDYKTNENETAITSVKKSLNYWSNNGMPNEKIVMTIPAFGRAWILDHPSYQYGLDAPGHQVQANAVLKQKGYRAYFELCPLFRKADRIFWNYQPCLGAYWVYRNLWFTNDEKWSVFYKMEHIKEKGYGGASLWALDMDDYGAVCDSSEKRYPLASVMNEQLYITASRESKLQTTPLTTTAEERETTQVTDESTTDSVSTSEATTEKEPEVTTTTAEKTTTTASEATDEPTTLTPSATTTEEVETTTVTDGSTTDSADPLNDSPVSTPESTTEKETATTAASEATDEPITSTPSATTTEELETTTITDETTRDYSDSNFLMPCYYTSSSNYRGGGAKYVIESYQPGLCTHIIYAFAQVYNREVRAYDIYDLADNNGDEKGGYYARVNALKEKQPDLKTLISVGGNITKWGAFEAVLASEEGRATFAISAFDFVDTYGFDGMEIWYTPEEGAKDNFTALIEEVKLSFGGKYLLTVAVEHDPQPYGYDIPALGQSADWVNVKTQDFHPEWNTTGLSSPLDWYGRPSNDDVNLIDSVIKSLMYWANNGMPYEKIVMTVPAFARGWILDNANDTEPGSPGRPVEANSVLGQEGFRAYFEVCDFVDQFNTTSYIEAETNYLTYDDGTDRQWYSYEESTSVSHKIEHITLFRYGGAALWALDLDDFNNGCLNSRAPYPLASVMHDKLFIGNARQNKTTTTTVPQTTTVKDAEVTEVTDGLKTASTPSATTAEKLETTTITDGSNEDTTLSSVFECPTSYGYYSDPYECQWFYHCDLSRPYHKKCPDNTLWDQALLTCNYTYLVNCNV